MPRIDEESKGRRKELVRLLVQRSNGIKESEIANELRFEKRTVHNYLDELNMEGKVYKEGQLWFSLPYETTRLRRFELEPEEAFTLYLATRLLVKQQDKRNEPAESALFKLAEVLTSDARVGDEIRQAARELAQRRANTNYQSIFQIMVRGYIYRRRVRIRYQPYKGPSFETSFATYLMEPSAVGYSTYIIGESRSAYVHDIRSYKLERIEEAALTREEYIVPATFPGLNILRSAWSIISSEKTERVLLRFSPDVKKRVLETQWHPSQDREPDPDYPGYLRWWVDVADTTDMANWIRGWGSQVEVLEPVELQKDVSNHVAALAAIYRIAQSPADIEPYRILWAKADRKGINLHRLLYHMIDVGLTAEAMWKRTLHLQLKQGLADWLNLSLVDTGRLVAFLSSLHDLGKASPAFQDHPHMRGPLKIRVINDLKAAGFGFTHQTGDVHARHEIISAWALRPGQGEALLCDVCGFDADFAMHAAQALGGHHGAWPRADRFDASSLTVADKGGPEWKAARAALVRVMVETFRPPTVAHYPADSIQNNLMLTLLSAVVSVADWIGSEYFPLEEEHLPIRSYVRHARLHAEYALGRVQWERPIDMTTFDFERVFPFKPSDAQREISAALNDVPLPALAIIEAPMGAGKTEAAFAVFADWARRSRAAGLYIAMPTTATSNQMHGRTAQFLSRQLGCKIEPLLVHSQALLREVPEQRDPVEDREGDEAAAQSWFLPRKKSLLMPYGVGTVDQALMSILQTKHFFVRLLGLAHKVVIFDEVHAYDAYMSELFERLLTWLRAVNASVVVLSATLPDKTRRKLIRAYTGEESETPVKSYPRLTLATADGRVDAIVLSPPPTRTLHFNWLPRQEEAIITKLRESLAEGGCAAVICNTVTRAQKLFQAIGDQEEKLCDDQNLILFHARFPLAWREEIEQKVLEWFGPGSNKDEPNPERPRKAIVVATQVIEQSLDLDFDVMISDHAPIDLLLQRAGRLHRHRVNNPRSHTDCLWIAEPPVEREVPQFDRADTYVYDKYVLLRSWLVLKGRESRLIELPGDMEELIESVYGDLTIVASAEMTSALAEAKRTMTNDQHGERAKARGRRVAKPDYEDLLWGDSLELEEDDPTVHETFRALTRSDRPGLSVICLHRISGLLYLEPDATTPAYDPTSDHDLELSRDLGRHALTIRRPVVESALLGEQTDQQAQAILIRWRRISALRYYRVAIFEDGVCRLPNGYRLELHKDSQLGLQIIKEVQ